MGVSENVLRRVVDDVRKRLIWDFGNDDDDDSDVMMLLPS